MKLFSADLVLLHPPSVYDFRQTKAEYGPISDVIFSTPAFEMYPIGFTSIAGYLESHGYNVRIVNIARQMIAEPDYDVDRAVAALDPALFGIDLHWLPHAQGALEIAKIVKRYHPKTPVVLGGLSSSYFHSELIESPFVDFVMRGDSTEEPMLKLLHAVVFGRDLHNIPNLTWKHEGSIEVNPLTNIPADLGNGPLPDIFYVVRSVFKYRSLKDVVPFHNWMEYPITAVLTSRGCPMSCLVCGGSRSGYRSICGRARAAFRPPEKLVGDVMRIRKLSRAPVFLIHDLRHGGRDHALRILELFKQAKPKSEIVLELSSPVVDDFLERVGESFSRWSLEITLESHIERIRRRNRRFACSNQEIESTIGKALANGARRIDIFFMIGLPGQTYEDAVGFDEFCRHLLERFDGDRRLEFFAAPLAPFLDPGSEAYERSTEHGYKLRFHTLEEHRQALLATSWKDMLNYETDSMTRDEIVAASYEAMRRLARLKLDWQIISQQSYNSSLESIDRSETAVLGRSSTSGIGAESVLTATDAAIFQKNYLIWPLIDRRRFASVISLLWVGLWLLLDEVRLLFTRRLPLFLSKRARPNHRPERST